MRAAVISLITMLSLLLGPDAAGGQAVVVGSKHFNEGYILAEISAQLLEDPANEFVRSFFQSQLEQ
ncbi:MAG: hypothetical protein L0Y78_05720 [candidate division NC10 bacterium]|nr:hypothetical protein [candidate division NC10 bacterium]